MNRAASILVILLLAEFQSIVEACRCVQKSHNQYFCDADYVIKAKVVGQVAVGSEIKYKLKNITVFKATAAYNALSAMAKKRVWTSNTSAACGANLNIGSVYLMAGFVYGGKLNINTCLWFDLWSDLSAQEKYNIQNVYGQGNNCAICCSSV